MIRCMQPYMEAGERWSVRLFRHARDAVSLIARLLLLSCYIDDCCRLVFRRGFMMVQWTNYFGMSTSIANIYWAVGFGCEIIGCLLVLVRKRVPIGLSLLLFVHTVQILVTFLKFFYWVIVLRYVTCSAVCHRCGTYHKVAIGK
jgi:hypothetical protein